MMTLVATGGWRSAVVNENRSPTASLSGGSLMSMSETWLAVTVTVHVRPRRQVHIRIERERHRPRPTSGQTPRGAALNRERIGCRGHALAEGDDDAAAVIERWIAPLPGDVVVTDGASSGPVTPVNVWP